MEALNLGDVRKFENGVIGVVLEESGPYYAVLMIDGSKRMVDKSLSYSIPRLKPEVRSMFNALSDAIIDYDNKFIDAGALDTDGEYYYLQNPGIATLPEKWKKI